MNSKDNFNDMNDTDAEESVSQKENSTFEVAEKSEGEQPVQDLSPARRDKRGVSPLTCVAIVFFAVLLTFMTTYVLVSQSFIIKSKENGDKGAQASAYEKIALIEELVGKDLIYEVDEDVLTDSVIKGYMYGLGDPYAEYFTKEEFEMLTTDYNAEMQGIGISITYNSNYDAIQVIAVFPDSPAEKAGILPGDIIAYVVLDGEKVSVSELGYTVAVSKLQGKAGTKAEFVVYRGKELSESKEFSIERGYVTEYTVTHRVYSEDPTVGIISISGFDSKTPEQFQASYDALIDAGCDKLVFDVRNNPGGELVSVCTVLDTLVPVGPVVRSVDKNGNEEVLYVSDENETDIPIAVLTNGNTASAGELFAAALKDYEKAVLVGETTFGKGCMQTVVPFNDGTAFKYTYRYYCAPKSENFDGVGIKPDVEIALPEESGGNIYTLADSEDTQLQAAVKELTK